MPPGSAVHGGLDGGQQVAVEYGVGALVGGITRFVFGREVVDATQSAFSGAPDTFPAYLDVPAKPEKADKDPNRALEDAAKAVGAGVSTGAVAVGTGVVGAADVVTRPFRSVDLDGDGVPDEPQALTAVKGLAVQSPELLARLAMVFLGAPRSSHRGGQGSVLGPSARPGAPAAQATPPRARSRPRAAKPRCPAAAHRGPAGCC